jgi:hypothetical protein
MIPRHQAVILVLLLAASAIMAVVLWNLRERAHQRLLQGQVTAPTQAPQVAPVEQATLMVASDADDTVTARVFTLPLPQNPEARARAILGKLFEVYAAPGSAHPAPGGAASVAQVFLLPAAKGAARSSSRGSQLAVVNFAGAFASNHPSGIEPESLTILSICATLRANLPTVSQVRFLVDGQPRATLAGHADLTRTYLTAETIPTEGAHP